MGKTFATPQEVFAAERDRRFVTEERQHLTPEEEKQLAALEQKKQLLDLQALVRLQIKEQRALLKQGERLAIYTAVCATSDVVAQVLAQLTEDGWQTDCVQGVYSVPDRIWVWCDRKMIHSEDYGT